MKYTELYNGKKNWIVQEDGFNPDKLAKTESVFVIGNGYMGIRSANEESMQKQTRNTFISGTFNKAFKGEVTELPNIPDVFKLDLIVDGQLLNFSRDKVTEYTKTLNLRNGEMSRSFKVVAENGKVLTFNYKRFVSLADMHTVSSTIEITSDSDCDIEFTSGIDGTFSNTGSQHLLEGNKRLFDDVLYYQTATSQSEVEIAIAMSHEFNVSPEQLIRMERRRIFNRYRHSLKANEKFEFTKFMTYATSIDQEKHQSLQDFVIEHNNSLKTSGYNQLLNASSKEWDKYWEEVDIEIEGDDFANLSVRYAMFQLRANAPIHDERMNIGAKGLSGEGYKGHTFWDTEIFMLPFFIHTDPEAARNLIKYRYNGLVGAKQKAADNNYQGAMYPWEAAWPTDGEVTPIWGAADIVTGLPTKIWSGFIEQHITADVIYGLNLYFNLTGDIQFMEDYGFEMIAQTSVFWSSRAEYNQELDRYEINEVVGPDEYKEHVNNNAFTNIMARWNMQLFFEYVEKYGAEKVSKFVTSEELDKIKLVSEKLYCPEPNQDGIIPQDDTYLTLDEIDLTKYKSAANVGSLFEEYSLDQVNKLQVSKQADILILFLLLPELYTEELMEKNFKYYEPRTLHDSSLSLSTHVVLANRLGLDDIVSDLFDRSCKIDIGQNMSSSDEGIHTASLGGIWQGVVYGFAGISNHHGALHVNPKLKEGWESLKFNIYYLGAKLEFEITSNQILITNHSVKDLTIQVVGVDQEVKANEVSKFAY